MSRGLLQAGYAAALPSCSIATVEVLPRPRNIKDTTMASPSHPQRAAGMPARGANWMTSAPPTVAPAAKAFVLPFVAHMRSFTTSVASSTGEDEHARLWQQLQRSAAHAAAARARATIAAAEKASMHSSAAPADAKEVIATSPVKQEAAHAPVLAAPHDAGSVVSSPSVIVEDDPSEIVSSPVIAAVVPPSSAQRVQVTSSRASPATTASRSALLHLPAAATVAGAAETEPLSADAPAPAAMTAVVVEVAMLEGEEERLLPARDAESSPFSYDGSDDDARNAATQAIVDVPPPSAPEPHAAAQGALNLTSPTFDNMSGSPVVEVEATPVTAAVHRVAVETQDAPARSHTHEDALLIIDTDDVAIDVDAAALRSEPDADWGQQRPLQNDTSGGVQIDFGGGNGRQELVDDILIHGDVALSSLSPARSLSLPLAHPRTTSQEVPATATVHHFESPLRRTPLDITSSLPLAQSQVHTSARKRPLVLDDAAVLDALTGQTAPRDEEEADAGLVSIRDLSAAHKRARLELPSQIAQDVSSDAIVSSSSGGASHMDVSSDAAISALQRSAGCLPFVDINAALAVVRSRPVQNRYSIMSVVMDTLVKPAASARSQKLTMSVVTDAGANAAGPSPASSASAPTSDIQGNVMDVSAFGDAFMRPLAMGDVLHVQNGRLQMFNRRAQLVANESSASTITLYTRALSGDVLEQGEPPLRAYMQVRSGAITRVADDAIPARVWAAARALEAWGRSYINSSMIYTISEFARSLGDCANASTFVKYVDLIVCVVAIVQPHESVRGFDALQVPATVANMVPDDVCTRIIAWDGTGPQLSPTHRMDVYSHEGRNLRAHRVSDVVRCQHGLPPPGMCVTISLPPADYSYLRPGQWVRLRSVYMSAPLSTALAAAPRVLPRIQSSAAPLLIPASAADVQHILRQAGCHQGGSELADAATVHPQTSAYSTNDTSLQLDVSALPPPPSTRFVTRVAAPDIPVTPLQVVALLRARVHAGDLSDAYPRLLRVQGRITSLCPSAVELMFSSSSDASAAHACAHAHTPACACAFACVMAVEDTAAPSMHVDVCLSYAHACTFFHDFTHARMCTCTATDDLACVHAQHAIVRALRLCMEPHARVDVLLAAHVSEEVLEDGAVQHRLELNMVETRMLPEGV